MYFIRKEFHFSASHQLLHLPQDHPCARLHGHNYVIIVELSSDTLNSDSFVNDYRNLAPIKDYIDNNLDHQHLNDVLGGIRTTSECIAKFLYDKFKPQFPELAAILISETPKTWAEYRP